MNSERYKRLLPVLGRDGLRRVQSQNLVVVGCGGIGWNFATAAVLHGFQRFLLIDDDHLELSNLSRIPLVYGEELLGRPKAFLLEGALKAMDSDCSVAFETCRIEERSARRAIRRLDDPIIIAAVDNNAARAFIQEEYQDSVILSLGAGANTDWLGQVSHMGCQVMLYVPRVTPCLFCRGLDRRGRNPDVTHASVALNAYVAVGLGMNLLLSHLTGSLGQVRKYSAIYDAIANRIYGIVPEGDSAIERTPGCPICDA